LSATAAVTSPPIPPAETQDFWGLLKSVAEAGALLAFFSSVLGWSYLASYFNIFGFRPWEIDVSESLVSIFAIAVLERTFFWVLPAVAIVFLVRAIWPAFPLFRGSGLALLLLILTLGLYQLGACLGRSTAREDLWDDSPRLPRVTFYVTETKLGYPSCISTTTPEGTCRLLFRSKGVYCFIEPFSKHDAANTPNNQPKKVHVYALPEKQVKFVDYQRGVN
jgi:hypothetical protein